MKGHFYIRKKQRGRFRLHDKIDTTRPSINIGINYKKKKGEKWPNTATTGFYNHWVAPVGPSLAGGGLAVEPV